MAGLEHPLQLEHGDLTLRTIRRSDADDWHRVRARNRDWLEPWEATNPAGGSNQLGFGTYVRQLHREARGMRALPMVITHGGRFAGQVTMGNVIWGSARQAYIGYWVDEQLAGRGIAPTSVAMVTDYALARAGLHRIEIAIRPENQASLRVVEKLGFRYEGERPRFLHIDGGWRDHLIFAMTAEELPTAGLSASRPLTH